MNQREVTSVLFVVLLLAFLAGCSSAGNTLAPDSSGSLPEPRAPQQGTPWVWDYGLFRVSADHSSIERLPLRDSDIHVNVTKFVEPPDCSNCLVIGKPIIQPDGTLKVKVVLKHPFPETPEFTGFDVRGTVIFPATRYWKANQQGLMWVTPNFEPLFEGKVPFYFSRAEDGGGHLLNGEGFTLFFFPGFHAPGWDLPIFKYKKGVHAYGPDPDSTINGYRVFTNDPDRHMFLVNDMITRTYHISPPEGEFIFGYVVDASWCRPTKIPVTDPKNDFPFWANCEDGYVLQVEHLSPFKLGTYGPGDEEYPYGLTNRTILAVTSQIYQAEPDAGTITMHTYVFCPDLTSDTFNQESGVAHAQNSEKVDFEKKIFRTYPCIREGTYQAQPGKYIALVAVTHYNYVPGYNEWPVMFLNPFFYQFIELDVVAGD